MTQKLTRLFNRYRKLLRTRASRSNKKGLGMLRRGNTSKLQILAFYERYGRWPSRNSENKREIVLSQRFNNYIAKTAPSFDRQFRRIALVTGVKPSGKSNHDVAGFKNKILAYVAEHGHVPNKDYGKVGREEACLGHKLDYYTRQKGDMTFLSKVYEADRCHKSGIAMKYRKLINSAIDVDKPLVNLTKTKLEE